MQKKQNAVRYLRSSKDRHDVSIESQRHELDKLAADRGYAIVGEYVDVVESGKDDDRPGFQDLIEAARSRDRSWSTVLVLDTSRLARRLAIVVKFEEEICRPRGITVVYKSLPEAEEAERALIKAVLHGVDEWHSLVSKRKGLAGMRQNVKNGYRAGGRAPFGYRLEHFPIGNMMRDGKPVLKSRLIPGPDSQLIQRFLKERANGSARLALVRRLGITLNDSSLVGIEWNALTYAGHTVWNVHNEQSGGRYVTGEKRRPREQWEIQRGTHAALISDEEAETILQRLEAASVARPRRTPADYLFTGLLRTSDGARWHGEKQRYYRAGNSYAAVRDVDGALLAKIASDLRSSRFTAALVQKTRTSYGREFGAELARLRESESTIARRISGFMDMAEKMESSGPVLRKVEELEQDRKRLARELEQAKKDASTAAAARAVSEVQVNLMLDAMATDMERLDRDKLKDFLFTICEGITLNPTRPASDVAFLSAAIHYKIPLARRDSMASPRPDEAIPLGKAISYVKIRRVA